jgi:signal transduction histidine kinase
MNSGPTIAQDELWRLFDLSLAPADGTPVGYIQHMLDGCVHLFRASGASVFLLNADTGIYELAAQSGIDSHIPMGASIRNGEGIAGACIASGKPMLVTDPLQHPLLRGKVASRRRGVGSSLVLPLMTPDCRCIGVLNLTRGPAENCFSEEDLPVAASLASHAALAAANMLAVAAKDAAKNEAQQARDKIRAMISCLGVAVLAVDADKRITDWNGEARELLDGYVIGEPFTPIEERIDNPVWQALERALDQAIGGSRAQTRAFDSEADRSWSIVGAPLDGGGATAVVQDFTPHVRAAQEMARLKRLAEIGQMTAAVAHEIRNPLTGISGAAQMICDGAGDPTEFGLMIRNEVDKLNSLCDEFLEFARQPVLKKERFALRQMLAEVVKHHAPAAEAAGVELTLKDGEGDGVIVGDPVRVRQVAHNLVLNAIQACKRGDRVTVEVGGTGFAVKDTGPGMDQAAADNLFTPFFTTKAKGTGLGLSNVRKIVDAHGGRVTVRSQPGQGTTFEVDFELRRIA